MEKNAMRVLGVNLKIRSFLAYLFFGLSGIGVGALYTRSQWKGSYERGLMLMQKKSYSEASTEFSRALESASGDPASGFGLGWAMQMLGRNAEARKAYQFSEQQLVNTYGYLAFNLGVLSQAERKYVDAIAHYKKAIQFNPSMKEANTNLPYVLSEAAFDAASKKDFSRAKEWISESRRLKPQDNERDQKAKKLGI